MIIDIILLSIVFIYLIIASITDIKTREVPDWLNYSLIFIAISLRLIYSLITRDFNYFFPALIALIIFFILGNLMYYAKLWGGGDSKLLIGLSIIFTSYPKTLLNYFNPNLELNFLISIWINLLLFGAAYGLIWSIFLAIKNKNIFLKEFKKLNSKNKLIKIVVLIAALVITILILTAQNTFLKPLLFLTALLVLIFPYLLFFVKAVENACMFKRIPVSKLTEGDWIVEDIKVKNKLLISKNNLGIEKKQIELLKKYKIKKVLIKEGIPFVPAFLIAIIISLIYGNIIPI